MTIAGVTEVIRGHDLVVVVGAQVFRYYPYVAGEYLPEGSELLQITSDPGLAGAAPVGDSLLGDALLVLEQLVGMIPERRRQSLISRVHLLVSLTGPASSGSADASRRCQGCSHPHQHLLDQTAPSFSQLLRQPGNEGLSPPFNFRRLVAHTVFGPVIADEDHQSPPSACRVPTCFEPRTPGGELMDQCSTGTTSHQCYRRPTNRPGHDLAIGIDQHSCMNYSAHRPAAR